MKTTLSKIKTAWAAINKDILAVNGFELPEIPHGRTRSNWGHAFYDGRRYLWNYKLEAELTRPIEALVAHEMAHHIQAEYLGYNDHEIEEWHDETFNEICDMIDSGAEALGLDWRVWR